MRTTKKVLKERENLANCKEREVKETIGSTKRWEKPIKRPAEAINR
jgi:hypothetical protein